MRDTEPMRRRRARSNGARARALAALSLALGVLVLGCGKSLPAPNGRAASAPAHTRGAAPSPLTRARAVAFARAVNLTASDLPGFRASPGAQHESGAERALALRLRQCAGPLGLGSALAEQRSPSFRVRRDVLDLEVSSEVSVAHDAATARRELVALRSARVRGCFEHYLDGLLGGLRHGGARLGQVLIATGTPPAPGASGSFAWRVTAPFAVAGARLTLYVDILGFVLGPARVTLVSSGAVRPFPAPIQQRLFTLLLARASARSP
jgi:hypothetical protein